MPHFTVKERVNRGKAARTNCPRTGHAVWDPAPDRPDPINLLEAQTTTRIPELVPIRYGQHAGFAICLLPWRCGNYGL